MNFHPIKNQPVPYGSHQRTSDLRITGSPIVLWISNVASDPIFNIASHTTPIPWTDISFEKPVKVGPCGK